MDYLICTGIISNLVAFIFCRIHSEATRYPITSLHSRRSEPVLSKRRRWARMIGLLSWTFIYSVTTHTIDTELREIFDYARFEKL